MQMRQQIQSRDKNAISCGVYELLKKLYAWKMLSLVGVPVMKRVKRISKVIYLQKLSLACAENIGEVLDGEHARYGLLFTASLIC